MSAHLRPCTSASGLVGAQDVGPYLARDRNNFAAGDGRATSGWWIVPVVVAGTAGWVAIIGALLG